MDYRKTTVYCLHALYTTVELNPGSNEIENRPLHALSFLTPRSRRGYSKLSHTVWRYDKRGGLSIPTGGTHTILLWTRAAVLSLLLGEWGCMDTHRLLNKCLNAHAWCVCVLMMIVPQCISTHCKSTPSQEEFSEFRRRPVNQGRWVHMCSVTRLFGHYVITGRHIVGRIPTNVHVLDTIIIFIMWYCINNTPTLWSWVKGYTIIIQSSV